MPEGSGRDILRARTEKKLAETVCKCVAHAYLFMYTNQISLDTSAEGIGECKQRTENTKQGSADQGNATVCFTHVHAPSP